MPVTHTILAKVAKPGVVKMVYAHPSVQQNSLVLNNAKFFTQPVNSLLMIRLKRMASGKRMIVSSVLIDVKSVEEFISRVTEETLTMQSRKETDHSLGSPTPFFDKFDGVADSVYYVDKSVPRFGVAKDYKPSDEEEESSDGFVHYGDVYIPEPISRALESVKSISTEGAANILVIGPSGNGKTSLGKSFAEKNGLGFIKVNCSVVRDPEEWFGTREAQSGTTLFVESAFTQAVKAGNHVILLDEINRLEPYLHNSLLPLLDETRRTEVHGDEIAVGPGTVFFCTMNLGVDFTGTFILDAALKNRMDITIAMGSLSFDREVALLVERTKIKESDAKRIVVLLEKIRDVVARNEISVDVSHRSALKIAKLIVQNKVTMKEALTFVIFNNAESVEQAKLLSDSVVGSGLGGS